MNPKYLKDYEDALYRFIEDEEGYEEKVYGCSQHVPTIGMGYALAEKSAGSFKPRAGLDDDLAKVGKSLTSGDKARLTKACDMLDNGTIRQAITGKRFKDPFDLTITREQAKQLFLICLPKYDAVLRQKLGFKLYRELQNSREMVTLFSLAYNAPSLIGKNLVSAVGEGNRARVRYQILYESNRKRDVVLDGRRHREAKEFGRYDGDTPTAEELRAEKEEESAHATQIAAYNEQMDNKRKGKSAKRASGTKTAQNKNRRQQPGSLANQNEVRRRIDDVKARWHQQQDHPLFERIMDLLESRDKVTDRDFIDDAADLNARRYQKRWS
jgi:hypothetical protein